MTLVLGIPETGKVCARVPRWPAQAPRKPLAAIHLLHPEINQKIPSESAPLHLRPPNGGWSRWRSGASDSRAALRRVTFKMASKPSRTKAYILDFVALLIERLVVEQRDFPAFGRRNAGLAAFLAQGLNQLLS
jgi:hypothetical protein